MRRFIEGALSAVPFDIRSRRVLDETLLDWAHEEAAASSSAGRLRVGVRAIAALARVVIVASVREVGDVPLAWVGGRVALFAAVPAVVLAAAVMVPMMRAIGWRGGLVAATLAPSLLLSFVPPAIALALLWRRRDRGFPPMGTAICVAGVMLVAVTFVLPPSMEMFGIALNRAMQVQMGSLGAVPDFVPRGAIFPPPLWPTVQLAGTAALAGAVVLLAGTLAGRIRLQSMWWIAALPLAHFGLNLILRRAIAPHGTGFETWLAAAIVGYVSLVFGRTAENGETAP